MYSHNLSKSPFPHVREVGIILSHWIFLIFLRSPLNDFCNHYSLPPSPVSLPSWLLTLFIGFAWFWTFCKLESCGVYSFVSNFFAQYYVCTFHPCCLLWLCLFSLLNSNHCMSTPIICSSILLMTDIWVVLSLGLLHNDPKYILIHDFGCHMTDFCGVCTSELTC